MLICKLVPLAQPTKQAANVLDIALLLLFIAKQQPPKSQLSCFYFVFKKSGKGNICLGIEFAAEMLMNPPHNKCARV